MNMCLKVTLETFVGFIYILFQIKSCSIIPFFILRIYFFRRMFLQRSEVPTGWHVERWLRLRLYLHWCFKRILSLQRSVSFLAHLSRKLTRWAYSIPIVRRPSVDRRRPSSSFVRRPHFQTWISLKPVGQSWSNFVCSITGVGKRLQMVLGKIGSKLWFPWQQKAPIDL